MSAKQNGYSRDCPDSGLHRVSFNFSDPSTGVPSICIEQVELLHGSLHSVRHVNNKAVTDHHSGRSIDSESSDDNDDNMDEGMETPHDVSDCKLLSNLDESDLSDLARQNNGRIPGQVFVKIWPPVYNRLDLLFSVSSLVIFCVDLGSDIALVRQYHVTGRYALMGLTLAFIIVPALISGGVSVVWSCIDYSTRQRHNRNKKQMIIRTAFTFFQLGRVYRVVEFIYHLYRTWKETDTEKVKDISNKAITQKRDAAILGLVDGFLESALQLLLQLYLVIIGVATMDTVRVLALLSSWFSTALTVTSYYRNVRRAESTLYNVRYGPSAVYMAWRLCELGPRFLLLGLCVANFLYIFLAGVGLHVAVIFAMNVYINPRLLGVCRGLICRYAFLLLVSFISIFCFINLKDGQTRKTMGFYYVVFYAENFVMMGVVVGLTLAGTFQYSSWYYAAYSTLPGLVLQLTFLLLYYRHCHPQITHNVYIPHEVNSGGNNAGSVSPPSAKLGNPPSPESSNEGNSSTPPCTPEQISPSTQYVPKSIFPPSANEGNSPSPLNTNEGNSHSEQNTNEGNSHSEQNTNDVNSHSEQNINDVNSHSEQNINDVNSHSEQNTNDVNSHSEQNINEGNSPSPQNTNEGNSPSLPNINEGNSTSNENIFPDCTKLN